MPDRVTEGEHNGPMTRRHLFLAAYDISSPRRLRQALYTVRDYATGGQKSVHECFLTEYERVELLERIADVIDPEADRFFLLRIDSRARIRVMGRGIPPTDPNWYYVG